MIFWSRSSVIIPSGTLRLAAGLENVPRDRVRTVDSQSFSACPEQAIALSASGIAGAPEREEPPFALISGEFGGSTEYRLPHFALIAKEVGVATEHLLPPFALIGLNPPPISTTWHQQYEKWHAALPG